MPELWHQDVPNRKEQLVYKKKDEGRKVLSSALIFVGYQLLTRRKQTGISPWKCTR